MPITSGSIETWMIRVPGVTSLYESVTMPPSAVPTARITSASLSAALA